MGAWQRVGRHGAGPVAESLHFDPQTPGREREEETLVMAQDSET